jgi:prepilin-type N-terminal cleavage/methylation domain-containing protein
MNGAIQRARQQAGARGVDESGFTMVELVMAMLIFGLVITGLTAMMSTSLNLTRGNRDRSVGANLASQEMDIIRTTDFAALAIGVTTSTEAVAGITYTITRTTKWVTQSGVSGTCGATAGSTLRYLSIVVAVSWPNMGGIVPVSSATILAPPPGTGSIEARVLDRSGQPVSNVTVTATNSDNEVITKTTGSDGCAFFSALEPDTFTVVASRNGFVDKQGSAAPSQTVDVYTGGIYGVQFDYDQAATINLTLQAISGTIPTAVSNATVTLMNAGLLPVGKKSFTGTTTSRSIGSLFPFSSGYEAWLGTCLDADPGATALLVNVTPGAASAGTVLLPRITVQTRNLSNAARPNVAITATHVADSGCGSGETYALGSTNASGNFASPAALPYGLWTITAAGQSGSTTCTGGTPTGQCRVTLVGGGSGATSIPTLVIKW